MKLFKFVISRILIFTIVLAGLTFVVVYFVGRQYEQQINIERRSTALSIVRLTALNAQNLFEDTQPLLLSLIQLPAVREKDSASCSELFAEIVNQRSLYARLAASDANGDIFCESVPLDEPINIKDRTYFQRAKETRNFVVSDFQIGRSSKIPVIIFAYPTLDESGEFTGLVLASVDLRWFEYYAAQAEMPHGAVMTIFDANGLIFARYPDNDNLIGKIVPENSLVQLAAEQHEGTVVTKGFDNKERIYAFTVLPDIRSDGGVVHLSIGFLR